MTVAMHVGNYLALLRESERELARGFAVAARRYGADPDIATISGRFAGECEGRVQQLTPLLSRYGGRRPHLPDAVEMAALRMTLFHGGRSGMLGVLRDVQDLWLLAQRVQLLSLLLWQAGAALRDGGLMDACAGLREQTEGQIAWLLTRVKVDGPQIVVTAP